MFENIVIIGASALGRKICNYARDIGMNVKGFLHDRTDLLDGFVGYPPIIGTVMDYEIQPGDGFVCALGDSNMRRRFSIPILQRGGQFVNIIHDTAYVGPNVKMGVGCVVCPQAILDCDLSVGDHAIINVQTLVAHDCKLGDYVTISPGCRIAGRVSVGNGSFLGIQSSVIPDIKIGANAIIAAGAVVTADVADSVMVAGVPAVVKKKF